MMQSSLAFRPQFHPFNRRTIVISSSNFNLPRKESNPTNNSSNSSLESTLRHKLSLLTTPNPSDGDQSSLTGSDVLRALQKAATLKKKKKNRRRMERGEEAVAQEEELDYRNVRPINVKREWKERIDELDMRVQELKSRFSPGQSLRGKLRNGSVVRCAGIVRPSEVLAPMGQKTEYKDGVFEKVFMGLFARKMEKFASKKSGDKNLWDWDYESFVDVSKSVMMGRTRSQQQEVVREVLLSMLPPGAPAQFRKLFPPTKWAAEFNAALTVPFFHWLVGPSEVIEVEVNGEMQRSGIRIKKCRYLENSGCVGMCVNMCKIPTQDFFTTEFGLPLTMNPNFEDMSCEMIYGQTPPPFDGDPVSNQPCYATLCSMANPSTKICHKLQN